MTNSIGDENLSGKPDLDLFNRAYEEFCETGRSSVACNKCNAVIKFHRVSTSAIEFACPCGLYKGDLRGL